LYFFNFFIYLEIFHVDIDLACCYHSIILLSINNSSSKNICLTSTVSIHATLSLHDLTSCNCGLRLFYLFVYHYVIDLACHSCVITQLYTQTLIGARIFYDKLREKNYSNKKNYGSLHPLISNGQGPKTAPLLMLSLKRIPGPCMMQPLNPSPTMSELFTS